MRFYDNEKDMPWCEIEKEDGKVHHLVCEGSRRHVISYDTHGNHCSEPRCEINKPKQPIGKSKYFDIPVIQAGRKSAREMLEDK
jgi:hypothetical protein